MFIHLKSTKHETSKKKEAVERDIASALKAHDAQTRRKGETQPAEHNAYRARVVTALMKSGISIAKLESLELSLLEENGYSLTDPRHMMDLILDEEHKRIHEEVQGKFISVVFDGTTRVGEVLAVVVRFLHDWKVEQCLAHLQFLQKSAKGQELDRAPYL